MSLTQKADEFLPAALLKIGEEMAREAWETLQKGFGGIEGFEPNTSSAEKAEFIRETAHEYARNATSDDRQELRQHLLGQLKELRANAS